MKRTYEESFNNDNDNDNNEHKIENVIRLICKSSSSNDENTINKNKNCNCNPYNSFVKAGPFILGCSLNIINTTQLSDVDNYIAKKINDNERDKFYLLKIVQLPKNPRDETQQQRHAKMMIYNEYSVLSLFKNCPGIIQVRGLYKDIYFEENKQQQDVNEIEKCDNCLKIIQNKSINDNDNKNDDHNYLDCKYLNKIGKFYRRLILAFDCHILHQYLLIKPRISLITDNFLRKYRCEYENLQEYVKRYKNIDEKQAIKILFEISKVINILHKNNVAHRDLRLENILYNHCNGKILLINFGLARYVINDRICINDYRGSSAYISPDVLKRRPYVPKPSDCWALGVIFYSMLLGKFPFHAETLQELFKKINSGHYDLPTINKFSSETMKLMRSLIEIDLNKRIKINELYQRLKLIIYQKKLFHTSINDNDGDDNDDEQIVPDIINDKLLIDNSIKRIINIEHDHDYISRKKMKKLIIKQHHLQQQQQESNKFEKFIQSSNLSKKSPPQMSIPFIRLRERFCYDKNENHYGKNFRNYHCSPFIEEMARNHYYQQTNNLTTTSATTFTTEFNSNPINLEFFNEFISTTIPPTISSSTTNSTHTTYNVIKVENDVRPLNEQEFLRLYAPYLSPSSSSSSPPPSHFASQQPQN